MVAHPCPEAPVRMITNPQQRADQYFVVSIISTETSETSGRIGQVKIADSRNVCPALIDLRYAAARLNDGSGQGIR